MAEYLKVFYGGRRGREGGAVPLIGNLSVFTLHSLCNALTETQLTRAYYYTADYCNGVVSR